MTDKEIKNKIYTSLPREVKAILLSSEGWLVGGSLKNLLEDKAPKDYDILVPNRLLFHNLCALKNMKLFHTRFNTYGGIKFNEGDIEVDAWCEELSHFLLSCKSFDYAFNIRRNILIKNLK